MKWLAIRLFGFAIFVSIPYASAQTNDPALRALLPPELISRLLGNGAGFLSFERSKPIDGTPKDIAESPMFNDEDWRRIIDEMDRIEERADKQVVDLLKANSSALWELLLSKTGPINLKQSAENLEWDRLTAEITTWSVRLAKYFILFMKTEPSRIKTEDRALEGEYSNLAIPYERNSRVIFRYLLESPKLIAVFPKRFDIERLRHLDAKTIEMQKQIGDYGSIHNPYLYSALTEIRVQPSVIELISLQAKSMEAERQLLEERAYYSRLDKLRAEDCDRYAKILDAKSAIEANGDVKNSFMADGQRIVPGSSNHYMLHVFFLKGCGGPKKFELARKILDDIVATLPPDAGGSELNWLCQVVHWSRVGIGKKLSTNETRVLEERYRKYRNNDCPRRMLVNPLDPWRVIPES